MSQEEFSSRISEFEKSLSAFYKQSVDLEVEIKKQLSKLKYD